MTEHARRFWPDCDTVLAMNRRSGGSDAAAFLQKLQPRFMARYQRYLEYLRDVVRHNVSWYATHGREKPKDSPVSREITKALHIFWEWNGEAE